MSCIKIGEVQTLNCENWKETPDDRQEMIQTIGGNIVQDFGHVESGDKITCTCNISSANKEKIFSYWNDRQLVTIIDEAGFSHENMRVIVRSYSYIKMFEKKKYYTIDFEFWRI